MYFIQKLVIQLELDLSVVNGKFVEQPKNSLAAGIRRGFKSRRHFTGFSEISTLSMVETITKDCNCCIARLMSPFRGGTNAVELITHFKIGRPSWFPSSKAKDIQSVEVLAKAIFGHILLL